MWTTVKMRNTTAFFPPHTRGDARILPPESALRFVQRGCRRSKTTPARYAPYEPHALPFGAPERAAYTRCGENYQARHDQDWGRGAMLTVAEVARMIDHSVLLPAMTDADLVRGVEICRRYGVGCLVPKTFQIPRAKALLQGTSITLCCPIAFPQGLNPPEVKRREAQWALDHGAQELDMVLNITALKSGDLAHVAQDIAGVVGVASRCGAPVKVILETCLLTREEIISACRIAEAEGAAFVKTSTQTQPAGATVEVVRLMRQTLGPGVQVKASGYITDCDKLLALYEAGARRFGTGYTVQILEGLAARGAQKA